MYRQRMGLVGLSDQLHTRPPFPLSSSIIQRRKERTSFLCQLTKHQHHQPYLHSIPAPPLANKQHAALQLAHIDIGVILAPERLTGAMRVKCLPQGHIERFVHLVGSGFKPATFLFTVQTLVTARLPSGLELHG